MFDLNKLLSDKGVDQKDFCEMTGISKKRFDNLLAQKSVLSLPEIERVSAFLGVSVPEFFNGVYVRKGELEEVAKANNVNRFSYFLKSATKKYDRFLEFAELLGTVFFIVFYLLFTSTIIFNLLNVTFVTEIAVLALVIPCSFAWECMRIGKKLIGKNIPPKQSHINYVSASFVIAFLLMGITTFAKGIIDIPVFVLLLVCSVLVAIPMLLPKLKIKDTVKELCGYVSIGLSAVLSFVSFVLVSNRGNDIKVDFENPYELLFSNEIPMLLRQSLVGAALFLISFTLIIFFVLYKKHQFVTKAYTYFVPMTEDVKENKANVAIKLIAAFLSVAIVTVVALGFEGAFYKALYSTAFEESEINWTAEYIEDFDSSFSEGEFDTIENNGAKIHIPKEFVLSEDDEDKDVNVGINEDTGEEENKDADENSALSYKNDNEELISFQFDDVYSDGFTYDLYKLIAESGDVEVPEEFLEKKQKEYERYFGVYPETYFDWMKLCSSYTIDDISIFNGTKARLLLSVFVMKSVAGTYDTDRYLYERDGVCASITSMYAEITDKRLTVINFDDSDSRSGKYDIHIITSGDNAEEAYDLMVKILNSISFEE